MVDAIGTGKVQVSGGKGNDRILPDQVTIPTLLLSQRGVAMMPDEGWKKPLIPGFAGDFTKLVVTHTDKDGKRTSRELSFDARGRLQSRAGDPLPTGNFEIQLVGKGGERFRSMVDNTARTVRNDHAQGYTTLKDLQLTRVVDEKPAPSLPGELRTNTFLLNPSGLVSMPEGTPAGTPLVRGFEGQLAELVVTQSRNGITNHKRYEIRDDGTLNSFGKGSTLGDGPFTLSLVGKDGSSWSVDVDVSSKAKKLGTTGYWPQEKLVFTRDAARTDAPSQSLEGVASDFARTGGAKQDAPTLGSSPVGIWMNRKS